MELKLWFPPAAKYFTVPQARGCNPRIYITITKNIVPANCSEPSMLLLAGFWDVMSTYMHYICVTFFVREILDGIAVWFLLCYSVGCLWANGPEQGKR